jgi:2-oxoglutarate dehydrogenase E2 component (dihydrolipoamide succinyltransferase)
MDIRIPSLGESITEATISKWFKNEGDAVAQDEPVLELETDKVTVEVPAAAAGRLDRILAPAGATVKIGDVVGAIAAGAAGGTAAPIRSAPPAQPKAAAPASAPAPAAPSGATAGPAGRKALAEAGLSASQVQGSGKDGRVTKADVAAASAGGAAQAKAAPKAAGPRETRSKMSRLRLKIAERLKAAQNTAAMLTTFNEVDMSNVMRLRERYKDNFEKRHGVRMGFMSFFVKACVQALKEIPAVNGEIDGDEIVYKNFYNIGVAVGTAQGLVVPVIRDCDELSLAGVEKAINEYGKRARDGKIGLEDLSGGTFTISNGGVYGSLNSTPILNPPQSGILGMHKIQPRPMAIGDKIEIRPMMYLALSYDHRIIDGREAVTFLVRVKECIEDPERLLLDV